MRGGILDIVIGGVLCAMGLSGRFSLAFTQSSTALAVAGGALAAWGVFKLIRNRPPTSGPPSAET